MLYLRRVRGRSMKPVLHDGQLVLFTSLVKPKRGSVVTARVGGRDVVKRVSKSAAGVYRLAGDNQQESTDSRHYGPIAKRDILGIMVVAFPQAVEPPAVKKTLILWRGRVAALIMIGIVLVQLFRIDTLLPIVQNLLVSEVLATYFVLWVVCAEIFAVPFLLRMRLSRLGYIVSGALVVLAPLSWLTISLAAYNQGLPTGQLGHFAESTGLGPAVINSAWLVFNAITVVMLGYIRMIRTKP